jgi:hypothetical protein
MGGSRVIGILLLFKNIRWIKHIQILHARQRPGPVMVPETAYEAVVEEELVAILRPAEVLLFFAGKKLQGRQCEQCRARL